MTNNSSFPTDPKLATTLPQLIRAAAHAYGDDTAIIYETSAGVEESLSFADLDRQSAQLARGLIARGVGKGSRIGFICGNNPSFAVYFAAIARAGGVAIPISTLIKSNELVRVLRQADLAGLIVQRELLGKDLVRRIVDALPEINDAPGPELRLPQAPFLRWIASTGPSLPPQIHSLDWLLDGAATVSEALLARLESEIHTTDQIMEIYTSGSMALPKGVKHNHGPAMARTHFIRKMTPAATRGQKLTVLLPMFWVGGLMMYLLPNWEIGATSVCVDQTLLNSRIAMGTVLAEEDLAMLKQAQMTTIWALGMTETMGPYSWGDELRVPGYPLCAPLDHIADDFEVRLADEDGREVAEGDTGEIQVRGYGLTPGLHKIENSEYFTADGFYRTGDMGFRKGNRILFTGRNGDMIKTASANVSPAEVEFEMQQLEGVHSAYVVGIPDQERGQLVVAAVVPRDGAELDFDLIQETLRDRLSGYKVPRAYVAIAREEVPMLPSNKVARRQIETLVAERLGRQTRQPA